MISVIMPTMWKGNKGLETIEELNKQEMIGEIIVIDNSTDEVHLEDIPKVVHIKEGKNTFVNPSWNKGAQLAKYDKLLFVNDDVLTDWSFVNALEEYITSDKGMIGAGVSCWQGGGTTPGVSIINNMTNCYGCVFGIHKNSYTHIPEDLLIHYGDNWLFQKSGKPNYQIHNWSMGGASEQTSGLTEFDTVKLVDNHNWNNKYK
jgi:GT2 family glycosyltransferase